MIRWLQGNPLGMALAALGGVLLLVSLLQGLAFNRPASSGAAAADAEGLAPPPLPQDLAAVAPVEEYAIITERPVFNESRRPEAGTEAGFAEVIPDAGASATDPEVRLTGVVITPDVRVATLTPSGSGEPVVAREGAELEGMYAGWTVSRVDARQVTLASSEGRSLQLDLSVHKEMIAEPPKPEPVVVAEEAVQAELEAQPMSRAEEIRQRIQERREQLRREAEANELDENDQRAAERQSYQDAIRAMMLRNRENENESGGSSDASEQ